MKQIGHVTGLLVAAVVALEVAASVLPRLIIPGTVIFSLAVIGRVAWWYTR
jgi:hypothetical protein